MNNPNANNDAQENGSDLADDRGDVNPNNLFKKLSNAVKAVKDTNNEHNVQNLISLVDKMTPRLFMKACNEQGDSIMEFIGPEIEENGGDTKKAI